MARPKEFDPDKALADALLLFWEKGYEATSVDDLVTRLNLNRSSLYHTFGDKHALFLETLRAYHQRVLRNVGQALAGLPVTEAFRLLCDSIIDAQPPTNRWGCLMVNSITELLPGDSAVATIADAYTADVRRRIRAAIERDQTAGVLITRFAADDLAYYLFNTMQGLKVMSKTGISRSDLAAARDITLSALG
jgi:TetR/AcrR family transcriptional regulator, transcriptional repressor for nem operon